MSLDLYFPKDVSDRLTALTQSNERTLMLAKALGANPRDIALVRAVYQGALADVGASFGLQQSQLVMILKAGVNSSFQAAPQPRFRG